MFFYDVFKRVDEGDGGNGARRMRYFGCNGRNHAEGIYRVYLKEDGEVQYSENIQVGERGPCDGSCGKPNLRYQGFFVHFPPSVLST